MTVATIHKIGKKNFCFSIQGGAKVKLSVDLLIQRAGGLQFYYNGVEFFVPLGRMPVLPIPKKFYLYIPHRSHTGGVEFPSHVERVTKRQAKTDSTNGRHLEVNIKKVDSADSSVGASPTYIIRCGKNMFYITAVDDPSVAIDWAMQHGLPFTFE